LTGIKPLNDKIIRTIRQLSQNEIENYVFENNLPFVEDSTNDDTQFTRNFIRKEIAPKILQRFHDALDSVERLSKIASEEDAFLNDLALKSLVEKGGKIYLSASTPNALFSRAVILALSKLGVKKDYEYVHVLQVENLKSLQSGAVVTLPKGVTATKEYGDIVFSSEQAEKSSLEIPFSVSKIGFENKTILITSENIDKPYLLFDGDKIPKNSVIRTRREGDVFTKFGGGTKKLKEYLIDKKIPLSERDELIVIASGKTVYLIVGVEISDLVRIDDNTINKLKIKLI
jgi:tRNA(Ile)-lysidine synthase